MTPQRKKKSIATLIDVLDHTVMDITQHMAEAQDAMIHDELNQAIGCLMGIAEKLENAMALYRTVIALHREGK
jgi:hypothetical protein